MVIKTFQISTIEAQKSPMVSVNFQEWPHGLSARPCNFSATAPQLWMRPMSQCGEADNHTIPPCFQNPWINLYKNQRKFIRTTPAKSESPTVQVVEAGPFLNQFQNAVLVLLHGSLSLAKPSNAFQCMQLLNQNEVWPINAHVIL